MVIRRAAAAIVFAAALLVALPSCRAPAGRPYVWKLPAGLPVPRVPEDNPMSAARVELGRRLFHDPRLSGNGTLACAGCHRPELAYTDGRARAVGALGDEHPRSAMSLTNVAYNLTLGWDDPGLRSLEAQARIPLLNRHPVEMGVAGREDEILARLRGDRRYRRAFGRAFPEQPSPVTLDNVVRALACFERTLLSGGSPFDRWSYAADVGALSPEARAGARLFFSSRIGCFRCHSGFNLSGPVDHVGADPVEAQFHNTGLYEVYPEPNTGVQRVTGRPEDAGRFRAPTLRNVALTAPYMHDGSIATLAEVVEHYAAGGRKMTAGPQAGDGSKNPRKDALVAGFDATPEERRQLVAFLESLTDDAFVRRARALAKKRR